MRTTFWIAATVLVLSGCAGRTMLADPGVPGSPVPGTSVNTPGAKSSQTGAGLMAPSGGQSSQR